MDSARHWMSRHSHHSKGVKSAEGGCVESFQAMQKVHAGMLALEVLIRMLKFVQLCMQSSQIFLACKFLIRCSALELDLVVLPT